MPQLAPILRAGRRDVVAIALGLVLWPALAFGAGRPGASHEERADVRAIGQRLSGCVGREDPACVEALLPEIERMTGAGVTAAYARAHAQLLRGQFDEASKGLLAIAKADAAPPALRQRAGSLAEIAAATAKATAGMERRLLVDGRFEVLWTPGPDEVMIELLEAVLARAEAPLQAVFGPLPPPPIRIHIYPKVETLAAVTGLTEQQIRTSGTIAVCKYNRLMLTSPRDLVLGYPWADTVVHELIHLLVTRRAGDAVPIWLHEAIARGHEGLWRGVGPDTLDSDEIAALQQARRSGRFIPLAKMSPTMAALPSQEAAQLAFAEVHYLLRHLLRGVQRPLGALLDAFAEAPSEEAAIERWAGTPRAQLLAGWMRSLRRGDDLPAAQVQAAAAHTLQFRRAGGGDRKPRGPEAGARFAELGDRLMALQRPAAAIIEYRKASAAGAPDDVWMWTRLARALHQVGDFDQAEQVAASALQRSPWHPPLLLIAGMTALDRKEPKLALERAESAMWVNPFDGELAALAAQASDALGDVTAAARWRHRQQRVATP